MHDTADFPLVSCWFCLTILAAHGVVAHIQVSRFLNAWVNGGSGIAYTPAGLAWFSQWGTLRYTMNTALIAEVWAQAIAGVVSCHEDIIIYHCIVSVLGHEHVLYQKYDLIK